MTFELEFRHFGADPRLLGHRFGDERVAADHRPLADDGLAAQDGRPRIDGHVVFDGRMPFLSFQQLTAAGGKRSQRDALIDLRVLADLRGLADHDARAVVDEEVFSQLRAGMDVDPGFVVECV